MHLRFQSYVKNFAVQSPEGQVQQFKIAHLHFSFKKTFTYGVSMFFLNERLITTTGAFQTKVKTYI